MPDSTERELLKLHAQSFNELWEPPANLIFQTFRDFISSHEESLLICQVQTFLVNSKIKTKAQRLLRAKSTVRSSSLSSLPTGMRWDYESQPLHNTAKFLCVRLCKESMLHPHVSLTSTKGSQKALKLTSYQGFVWYSTYSAALPVVSI